jgi:steroid delta-isomerase-like uncharacterized protein
MSQAVDIRDLVRAVVAAWNSHDIALALSLYASDAAMYDVGDGKPQLGHEGFTRMFGGLLRAFPDARFIEDRLLVEGQEAVLFWTLEGTHQGKLMNIPPTGRPISVKGVSFFQFRDAKVARIDRIWDVAGVLRTIGLLPEL